MLAQNDSLQTATSTQKTLKRQGFKIKYLLFLVIFLVITLIILLFSKIKTNYTANSIALLKKEVPSFFLNPEIGTENWDKLEIANSLDNVDKVVFVYHTGFPLGSESDSSRVFANIKFTKPVGSEKELTELFAKALRSKRITPLSNEPGTYCFKKYFSKGYYKIDVLSIDYQNNLDNYYFIDSSSLVYPTDFAQLRLTPSVPESACKELWIR